MVDAWCSCSKPLILPFTAYITIQIFTRACPVLHSWSVMVLVMLVVMVVIVVLLFEQLDDSSSSTHHVDVVGASVIMVVMMRAFRCLALQHSWHVTRLFGFFLQLIHEGWVIFFKEFPPTGTSNSSVRTTRLQWPLQGKVYIKGMTTNSPKTRGRLTIGPRFLIGPSGHSAHDRDTLATETGSGGENMVRETCALREYAHVIWVEFESTNSRSPSPNVDQPQAHERECLYEDQVSGHVLACSSCMSLRAAMLSNPWVILF